MNPDTTAPPPAGHRRPALVALKTWLLRLVAALLLVIGLFAAWVAWVNSRGDSTSPGAPPPQATAEQVARGAYLARVGNCMGCHTARGGPPFAGGRGIDTPFGTVQAGNLTPDVATGLGAWSFDDFWRALHHGRSRDGRLLYPAFPYPNFTLIRRDDADALFAYLRSLPAVSRPPTPHALTWPASSQAALAVWRALYFRPADAKAGEPAQPAQPAQQAVLTRGAYLVNGLGHCSACHATRDALGGAGNLLNLDGGLMPGGRWLAPSLRDPAQAGLADWRQDEVMAWLRDGVADVAGRGPGGAGQDRIAAGQRHSAVGPMTEVVLGGTQYLNDADLQAMAAYLRSLPPPAEPVANALPATPRAAAAASAALALAAGSQRTVRERGARLYDKHCASCHGDAGEGVPGVYAALMAQPAGSGPPSRIVMMEPPVNVVRLVLDGGFPPATAGHLRPHGMPPFAGVLSDDEVAALLTSLRLASDPLAQPVSALDVLRLRQAR